MFAAWIPLNERSKLSSFVFSGTELGTFIGIALSGKIIQHYRAWEPVFYIFGISALIWFLIFGLNCYNGPESHPFITDEEKEFLKNEVGTLSVDSNVAPTPWNEIYKNIPVLALLCAKVGHDFGYNILITNLPKVKT